MNFFGSISQVTEWNIVCKLLMDRKVNNLRRLLISAIPTSIFQLIINGQVSILFYIKVCKKKAYSEIIGYIPNTLIEKILLSFIFLRTSWKNGWNGNERREIVINQINNNVFHWFFQRMFVQRVLYVEWKMNKNRLR